jgi:NAD(P)-dependent dehydrogenase (short-subunit alcohol dehydrogenase family)
MRIEDTRAIITGGASGLGQAVAEDVVAAGGRVALLDVNGTAGQALAERLGGPACFIETDVTSEAAVNAAVAQASQSTARASAGRSAWSARTARCPATSSAR